MNNNLSFMGNTIIHNAVLDDKSPLNDMLRDKSLIDIRNRFGRTAMHTAVLNKRYTAVLELLAAGFDPQAADINGITPWNLAMDIWPTIVFDDVFGTQFLTS